MGNTHNLKDEASEDSAKGMHSPRRNILQCDKGQRLGQGVNPSHKYPALYVGTALGDLSTRRLMQAARNKEREAVGKEDRFQ